MRVCILYLRYLKRQSMSAASKQIPLQLQQKQTHGTMCWQQRFLPVSSYRSLVGRDAKIQKGKYCHSCPSHDENAERRQQSGSKRCDRRAKRWRDSAVTFRRKRDPFVSDAAVCGAFARRQRRCSRASHPHGWCSALSS